MLCYAAPMKTIALTVLALTMVALAGPAKADPGPASGSAALPPAAQGTGTAPVATAAPAFPVPEPAQAQAMLQTFERVRVQERQLQAQARAQMLAALSPAHRALVATLVGQLAVAPNPDQVATARQLDAMLSPSEQQAILRVNAGALAQGQTLAQQMQSQFVSQMTPEQRSAMERHFAQMKSDLEKRLTPEQRSAMQREGAYWKTMTPPAGVATMLSPLALAQDAGSLLLRTLTMPNGPFGMAVHFNSGAGWMQDTIIQRAP